MKMKTIILNRRKRRRSSGTSRKIRSVLPMTAMLILLLLVIQNPAGVCALASATTKRKANIVTTTATESSLASASSSIGARIQECNTPADLLTVAHDFWLPTDVNVPSHLATQRVHHEKRLRWSAQWLTRLGDTIASRCSSSSSMSMTKNDGNNNESLWKDPAIGRAIRAASIPFQEDRPEKEGRYLIEALVGLHNILGYTLSSSNSSANDHHDHYCHDLPSNIQTGIRQLVQRADQLAPSMPLPEAAEMRWACRGIFARSNVLSNNNDKSVTDIEEDGDPEYDRIIPQLNARVATLPFDIIPRGIDWEDIFPIESENNHKNIITKRLQAEIPFAFDTIVTRTGEAVTERRGTAWIADDGIGALAYSGKLMKPHSISDPIRTIMRQVEERVLATAAESKGGGDNNQHHHDHHFPRPFFDCALCNHYPANDSACKFHTDPEHGTLWHRLNCVVAAGSPRRFAFRPIPGHSTWSAWEPNPTTTATDDNGTAQTAAGITPSLPSDPNTPAVITLFAGDICVMNDSCNDDFHHAVYKGQRLGGDVSFDETEERVSLVLKRALVRSGGLRGHGLAGEGRRSRRKATVATAVPAQEEPQKQRRQRQKVARPSSSKKAGKKKKNRDKNSNKKR